MVNRMEGLTSEVRPDRLENGKSYLAVTSFCARWSVHTTGRGSRDEKWVSRPVGIFPGDRISVDVDGLIRLTSRKQRHTEVLNVPISVMESCCEHLIEDPRAGRPLESDSHRRHELHNADIDWVNTRADDTGRDIVALMRQ